MKHKPKPNPATPMSRIITDDNEVKRLAKRAGVWHALRDARRNGKTALVLHGMTVFGAFLDGYAAYTTSNPAEFLEVFATLALEMGCADVELQCTQRTDPH